MAKKKSTSTTSEAPAAPVKAPKKGAATKKTSIVGKAAGKPAAKKASASTVETAAKSAAPAKKAASTKKAAAPVKLTENQTELLKKVHGTGEVGLPADTKGTAKSLEALKDKKLIKKGKKNKESGHVHYHVSKAGEKHIGSSSNPTT